MYFLPSLSGIVRHSYFFSLRLFDSKMLNHEFSLNIDLNFSIVKFEEIVKDIQYDFYNSIIQKIINEIEQVLFY